MQAAPRHSKRSRSWWPVFIILPPVAAVLGGLVTVYVSSRHPDVELRTAHAAVQTPEEKRHVSNSVVPPLR